MLRLLLASLLLLSASRAHADDAVTHDGGWDMGARVALAGAIAFSALYTTTIAVTPVADGLCGLSGTHVCNHSSLYIPLVGGLLPAPDQPPLGVASSILQICATGVMIYGLGEHRWRVKR